MGDSVIIVFLFRSVAFHEVLSDVKKVATIPKVSNEFDCERMQKKKLHNLTKQIIRGKNAYMYVHSLSVLFKPNVITYGALCRKVGLLLLLDLVSMNEIMLAQLLFILCAQSCLQLRYKQVQSNFTISTLISNHWLGDD